MNLTPELLTALGFVEVENCWMDSHCKVYKDQLPGTLLEFKTIITGTAFNKGRRKGLAPSETYTDSLPAIATY